MFSIYITKKSIVLQPSQQTLLQQVCRVTFSGSSGPGSSSRRKSQSIYMRSYLCFLLFFFYYQAKGKYEDEAQLAQFALFYTYLLSRNVSCDSNNNGTYTTQADVSLFWP